jgi:hypothetical protein
MFACSAAVAFWRLSDMKITHPLGGAIAYMVPAMATVVLLLLIFTFPDLMSAQKPAFPVNLTLPVLHSAMVYAIASLVTSEASGIEMLPEALLPSVTWLDWRMPATACLLQIGVLSVVVYLVRNLKPA